MDTRSLDLRHAPAIVALAIGLAGCAPKERIPRAPRPTFEASRLPAAPDADPTTLEAYPKVVAYEGLAGRLVTQRISVTEPGADGAPLIVTISLRSIADQPQPVQYRFRWTGPDGEERMASERWRSLTFAPNAARSVRGNPIDDRAVDWTLELRPAAHPDR